MIYAIATEGYPYIKFGRAKKPTARLKELQTGSPHQLRLVAAVDWHDSNERVIHDALRDSKYRSEWFLEDEDTIALAQIMGCQNCNDEDKRFSVAMELITELKISQVMNPKSSTVESGEGKPKFDRNAYQREWQSYR